MWRRISSNLKTLDRPCRSLLNPSRTAAGASAAPPYLRRTPILARYFAAGADTAVLKEKNRVEDIMSIATGHEREELEGKNLLDVNYPTGPFGTKESPAVIKSYYNRRVVGCPGGEDEDEHDVVWFWLEKDKPHECPVCSQYFVLKVVGPGGDPEGQDDHH